MKGIDVSSYNGTIDWSKVKYSGVDFAIIKAIRKDLTADKKFYENWDGCVKNNIPIAGVYNYSYATTEDKARTDAKMLLMVLGGRKCTVWLDVEDNCQKKLGTKLIAIIDAYAKVITDAGYPFGVYTGLSFYNSYIKKHGGVKHKLWIARYGLNNGIMNVKYQPQLDNLVGWQYTSRGSVKGINGNVDMNVWYSDIEDVKSEENVCLSFNTEPKRLLYYRKPLMMRGDDVKWVQERLVSNGFLPETEIDGFFGKKTDKAVRVFQSSRNIVVDGKVGVVTREYMKK